MPRILLLLTALPLAMPVWSGGLKPDYIFGGRYTCNEDYPQCRAANAQQEQVDRMREMNERMEQQRQRQERGNNYPNNDPNQWSQTAPSRR